jgi:hypothetical protein
MRVEVRPIEAAAAAFTMVGAWMLVIVACAGG